MKLNLNDRVRVRLTYAGLKQLDAYRQSHPLEQRRRMPDLPEGNLYETQLWEVMRIFGPECTVGSDVAFVGNVIEFVKDPQ